MGKSRNSKRSKMLHQRKKQREKEEIPKENRRSPGESKLTTRLRKAYNSDIRFKYLENPNRRKISEVVLEMIQPLLDDAESFDEEKNIVGLGIMAWNLGIIKKNNGKKEMKKALKDFEKELPKPIIALLLDFSEIKCKYYGEYNEIIVDYEYTKLNSRQKNLLVSYEPVDE